LFKINEGIVGRVVAPEPVRGLER